MKPTRFAIRFLPESGGDTVALDAYAASLEEIVQGLDSLRHTLAPQLARRVGWPMADVRDYLRLAVLPVIPGSVVVPVVMGASFRGSMLQSESLERAFWRYGGAVVKGAARQRVGVADMPAVCAEHFARASSVARERGRAGLQLVESKKERSPSTEEQWRPIVDLTRVEDGLVRYAERRNVRRMVETVLIGRVRTLVWEPPQVQIEMANGKTRTLALSAAQRKEAAGYWGSEVAAYVDANITLDGEIRDTPRVRRLQGTVHIDDLAQDLKETFGMGRDVWGTKEAEEYLKGLRGRDS